MESIPDLGTYHYEYVDRRGISKTTHEFFKVRAKIGADGAPTEVEYPYSNGAIQFKRLNPESKADKFRSSGPMSEAAGWGPAYFPPGSAKAITITEGNDDAMATYQMLGRYPVYAVKSSSSAVRDVRKDYAYLNSFDRVYLALDSDEVGQKAAKDIAAIFGYGKVYHVQLTPLKDATEYSEAGKYQEFRTVWHNAKRFLPEGIISSFDEIDAILDQAPVKRTYDWPFAELNYITDGIKLGTSYMFSGLEGRGKTEVFHAVEHFIAQEYPEAKLGIIHLEEDLVENIKKKASYVLKKNCMFSDSEVTTDEIKAAYKGLFGDPDRIHFYNHHGSDDPDVLLAKIRFLVAACGCKVVFLDNITIIGTGRQQDDERKELDYLSTKLEMMVKELNFTLIFICHENDYEQTRGSRNISKVCDVWVRLVRDTEAEGIEQLITHLYVKKGRGCRRSGPAGKLIYDTETGTLSEMPEPTGDLPT